MIPGLAQTYRGPSDRPSGPACSGSCLAPGGWFLWAAKSHASKISCQISLAGNLLSPSEGLLHGQLLLCFASSACTSRQARGAAEHAFILFSLFFSSLSDVFLGDFLCDSKLSPAFTLGEGLESQVHHVAQVQGCSRGWRRAVNCLLILFYMLCFVI